MVLPPFCYPSIVIIMLLGWVLVCDGSYPPQSVIWMLNHLMLHCLSISVVKKKGLADVHVGCYFCPCWGLKLCIHCNHQSRRFHVSWGISTALTAGADVKVKNKQSFCDFSVGPEIGNHGFLTGTSIPVRAISFNACLPAASSCIPLSKGNA